MDTAFTLFLTGMISIFVILSLVVGMGNLLIKLVNRYFPDQTTQEKGTQISNTIDKAKLAAIAAAVDIATEGKGKIISVQPLLKP